MRALALAAAFLAACVPVSPSTPTQLPLAPSPSLSSSPVPLVPSPSPSQSPAPLHSVATIQPTPELPSPTAKSGTLVGRLEREAKVDGVMAMAWSPDGERIALTTTSGVLLLDSSTLSQVAAQTTDLPQNALAFSADGTTLATVDHFEQGRTVRLWDTVDLTFLREHDLPGDENHPAVIQLGFLPNGDLVVATAELPGMAIWTISPSGATARLFVVEGAYALMATLDPVHGMVAVPVGREFPSEVVQVWDIASASMRQEAPLSNAGPLQFSHDGRELLALLDFVATTWDIGEARIESQAPFSSGMNSHARFPIHLTISHDDGVFASVTEIPSPGIGLWDVHTGQLLGLMRHDELGSVEWLSFSPAKNELAVLLEDGCLQVWEVATAG